MSDDLIAILDGVSDRGLSDKGKATLVGADLDIDPDIDRVVRTVYGEASGEDVTGRRAVAAVIRNRAIKSGKSYSQIVDEPGQFEPWGDAKAKARMEALRQDSPEYKAILGDITPALLGEADPTDGATHFYAPKAQADLGRAKPVWDDGTGFDIGNHRFFRLEYGGNSPGDLLTVLGGDVPAGRQKGSGAVVNAKTGGAVNEAQTNTYKALSALDLDPNAEVGSVLNPPAQQDATIPNKPGFFWVDLDGRLQQVPGGPDATILEGVTQGSLGDTALSIARLLGPEDSEIRSVLEAGKMRFEAAHGDEAKAGVGRVVGQLAATLPALTVGGGAISGAAGMLGRAAPIAAPIAEFLTGAAKGNRLITGASRGIGGAAEGLGSAALVSGASDAPLSEQLASGAALGAGFGALGPEAWQLAKGGLGKLAGGGVSPEVAQLANRAENRFGIPIQASQISESPFVRYTQSVLNTIPLSGQSAKTAKQRDAFTAAVAQTIGEEGGGLTQAAMSRARKRIGAEFDRVAQNTTIRDTDKLLTDLGNVVNDASGVLPEGDLKPLLNQVDRIGSAIQNRQLTGESYQALTRSGTSLDRLAKSADPNIRHYALQMKAKLDDALEASATGEDLEALKTARRQYKNMKTLEDLAEKAGPNGVISPALLLNKVRQSYGDYAYSGGGDLGELAQIGQRFIKEPPSSGTSERQGVRDVLKILGLTGGGVGIGTLLAEPSLATKATIVGGGLLTGGALGARGVGAVIDNPLYKALLLRASKEKEPSELTNRLTELISANYVPASVLGGQNLLLERRQQPPPSR